jgi:hypothetical protein
MTTQRSIVKPVLALAIMFLIAISVVPALAADTTSGDMNINPVVNEEQSSNYICPDWIPICHHPWPEPYPIVGQCTIDKFGIKHCPYPPFIIYANDL